MLRTEKISKTFYSGALKRNSIPAVCDVSMEIHRGEHLGLVGDSGCGKSTLARILACLLNPDTGNVIFEDKNIHKLSGKEQRKLRREIQIIFQNPQQSFHPRMKLYETLAEPIRLFHLAENVSKEREMIEAQMEVVGLTTDIFSRYPHEISGGQAQRIALLRSLMLKPKLLIADEPTSMLDVSVQAQILRLIKKTTEENNISLLLISHDQDVIRAMSDTVLSMKEGKIQA